jgi:hypothetical protein
MRVDWTLAINRKVVNKTATLLSKPHPNSWKLRKVWALQVGCGNSCAVWSRTKVVPQVRRVYGGQDRVAGLG